ncbi:MAG: hypothetical protein P4M08_15435 [Oligoflexia bacterium]|nr:hypothetical protein [Oligoflexia bacterium]
MTARRKFSNRLTYTLLATASLALASPTIALAAEFKFPALLCVYRYSMVSDRNAAGTSLGSEQLYGFDTGEQALRVQNIHDNTGEISAEYDIPDTAYRFRFDGKITQNAGGGRNDVIQLRTFLEKKNPATGEYAVVGMKMSSVSGTEAADGSIYKNIFARASNNELNVFRGTNGKIDPDKVAQGIQAGQLAQGTVFNAGPVCGLMDMRTLKSITNHAQELSDLLGPAPAAAPATVNLPVIVSQSPALDPSPTQPATAQPEVPNTPNPARDEFEQAYPELATQTTESNPPGVNDRPAAPTAAEIQSQEQQVTQAEAEARKNLAVENGEVTPQLSAPPVPPAPETFQAAPPITEQ